MRAGSFFPFQTLTISTVHSHRAGTHPRAGRLPTDDNAFLAIDGCLYVASGRRQIEPGHHPPAARLLGLDPGPKFSAKERKQPPACRASAHLPDRGIARNFGFQPAFPFYDCSSAAANSACGGSPPTRLPRSSEFFRPQDAGASSPPSSIRSTWPSCLSPISSTFLKQYEKVLDVSAQRTAQQPHELRFAERLETISMSPLETFQTITAVSRATRHSGSMSTSNSRCYSALPSPSPSAPVRYPGTKSATCA